MTRPIRSGPRVEDDLESIALYIAQDSVHAAMRFLDAARLTIESLCDFPERGAAFASDHKRLQGIRWIAVQAFENHLVFYRVEQTHIRIVRVLQAARDLEEIIERD